MNEQPTLLSGNKRHSQSFIISPLRSSSTSNLSSTTTTNTTTTTTTSNSSTDEVEVLKKNLKILKREIQRLREEQMRVNQIALMQQEHLTEQENYVQQLKETIEKQADTIRELEGKLALEREYTYLLIHSLSQNKQYPHLLDDVLFIGQTDRVELNRMLSE